MAINDTVRLFVLPDFSSKQSVRLLDLEQKESRTQATVLFKEVPTDFAVSQVTRTLSPDEADFFIVPQSVKKLDSSFLEYLTSSCLVARTHGKKVIVFLSGDYSDRVHIETSDVFVFKGTSYKNTHRKNEIVFAPFVEDLGQVVTPTFRVKGERPMVSFCGYAGLSDWKSKN